MDEEKINFMRLYVGGLTIIQNYTKRCNCSVHSGRIVISVAVQLPNGRPAIMQEEDDGFRVEVGDRKMIGRGDLRDMIPVPYETLSVEDAIHYLRLAGL